MEKRRDELLKLIGIPEDHFANPQGWPAACQPSGPADGSTGVKELLPTPTIYPQRAVDSAQLRAIHHRDQDHRQSPEISWSITRAVGPAKSTMSRLS